MVMESSSAADHHHHLTGGGVVLSSSIVLLQERFRQLQKMKEVRQEKELQKMLSESDQIRSPSPPPPHPLVSCHNHYAFAGHELKFFPPKVQHHCKLSLSLWTDISENWRAGSREGMINGPPLNLARASWFPDEPLLYTSPSPIKVGNSGGYDVDTSLHL